MRTPHWLWAFLPAFAFVLSACSSAGATVTTPDAGTVIEQDTPTSPGIVEDQPTSMPNIEAAATVVDHTDADCEDPLGDGLTRFSTAGWDTNFCIHGVAYDEIFSGGPPRDGIPPIDAPKFEPTDSADGWLAAVEPVIALEIEGEARAYPLQILIWHEIVNDTVGGLPVAVTFCPLCNTALVFERPTMDGQLLTFGTSGNLRNSDLVMWDRQTESWWQQFSGEAIVGDLTGTRLTLLPSAILSWADFKAKYPQGQVLSLDTGFLRNYGQNPYADYDNVNSTPFLYTGDYDDRLPPMARVLGVLLEDGNAAAYALDLLNRQLVLQDVLGETPFVVFWKAGTASAVDSRNIAAGRDVGTTGVFESTVDGQVLTFSANGDGTFEDTETGSTWDILGNAIQGSLAGTSLTAIPHHDTFWFAWAAFVPEGKLAE